MKNNTMLIQALSQDLYRAAIGLHRGSITMAQVFSKEAHQKIEVLEKEVNDKYIKELINYTKPYLSLQKHAADQLLMYSSLFKNYILMHPNI